MSIAHFAVSRRVSVAMLAMAIVVLGIFAVPRLAVALLPTFQPPIVSVSVSYGNVAPATMESTITRPLENAVSRVAGIDYLRSNSYQGQSVIRAQFKYGTNIDTAAVDVQQQVARVQSTLPNDPSLQQPQIIKADPNALPVVIFFVTDSARTTRDLSDLFTNVLADEFSAISGVGSVNVSGTAQRAVMVEPNPSILAGYGLDPSAIVNKLKAENVDLPAGVVQIGRDEFGIRTNALYQSTKQISDTVVAIRNGAPITMRDVAKVSDSIQEQRIFGRLDGTSAIRLFVTAQPDANVVAVSNGVYAKIDELKHRYPTMNFGVVLDQRGFIQDAITALQHTAIYGAILAVLIILLFLHSWRSTLIVAVSLPISVLGTLFACYLFHLSLNTMTLGGLALAVGLIVDDAVVVVENIYRHLAEGQSPLEAAESATAQIFTAVLASSITVVTVFFPLLLIPGLQGLIFGPMALVIMVGVAISFVVAVTTVPMLSSQLLKSEARRRADMTRRLNPYERFGLWFDARYERFANGYRRVLAWSVDHPAIILGSGVLIFACTLLAMKMGVVNTETFPASDSRFVRFDVRLPNGTALDRTNRVSRLVEDAFKRDPRVTNVGSIVGTGYGGGTSRSISSQTSLSVTLQPHIMGPAANDFVNDWQTRLGGVARRPSSGSRGAPGASSARADFAKLPPDERQRRIALRRALVGAQVRGRTIDIVQQQVSQGSDALQIQIFGPDNAKLYQLAVGAEPALSQIAGVVRPDTNVTAPQPELDVNIDRRRVAELGFSTGDVANDIDTATNGATASYYQLNGVQYPIIVELPALMRRSYASISQLALTPPANSPTILTSVGTITTPTNIRSSDSYHSVPLSDVAGISIGVGPAQISRQDKQREIDIDAPVLGRPLGAVIADATDVMNNYSLPSGYRWQWGPQITQNNDTFASLGLVVVLAIALIYMLLASQFESYIDPLVIMMAVPLSLTGIVGSLVITHRAFGLTAFIGSLMLVGIAVKNAILVIEFTKQLRHQGMTAREALLHAGPLRLRPIMMTTLATLGGMLPLALALEAGSSTNAPLGTVVIGGLITSSVLSLLVVPTLYLWSTTHVEPRFGGKPPKLTPRQAGATNGSNGTNGATHEPQTAPAANA